MKKGILLAVFVTVGMLSVSAAAFARDIAIGAEVASVNFSDWGGRVVFHIPHIPLYFGVGGEFESGASALCHSGLLVFAQPSPWNARLVYWDWWVFSFWNRK
jgi:hypothetical protein